MPQQTQQQWNPVAAFHQKWPDAGLSDQQILTNLQNPTKFRSAFPEYTGVTDDEIRTRMATYAQTAQSVVVPKASGSPQGAAPQMPVPTGLGGQQPETPIEPTGYERFMHAAGLPARLNEVSPMIHGILRPQESPTDPGYGQTIPVLGPAFRAQRETYDQPGLGKVYGSIPLVGPPGYQMGKELQAHDYPAAAGSLVNIVTQILGARKLAESPLKTEAGTPVEVPYARGAETAPGVKVTGAPQRFSVGAHLAQRLGLSSEYANRVAQKVADMDEIRKARDQDLLGMYRKARDAGKELNAHEAGALQNVQQQLQTDIENVERSAGVRISALKEGGDQALQSAQGRLQNLEQQRAGAGQRLLSDAAKAVFEEHARVKQPFLELNEQIEGPVSEAGDIRNIITSALENKQVRLNEVPSAATKALGGLQPPHESAVRIGGLGSSPVPESELPESIRSILTPEEQGLQPLTFGELTRIKEDLYGAATGAKDGAVRAAMTEAADRVTKMQEGIADDHDLGDKFRTAKRDYSQFMRGAGSGLMQQWLSAKDVEEQAIAPKLAQLTSRTKAEALRTVLRSLGVDVTPLDKIIEEMGGTKAAIKEIPKQTAGAVKGSKADLASQIAEIQGKAREQTRGITSDTALEQRLNRQELLRNWKQRVGQAEERIAPLEEKGQIVPGKTTEELQGLGNRQINTMRMRALLNNMRSAGIGNPHALAMIVYGLTRLTFGSPWGALVAAYGLAKGGAPVAMQRLLESPATRDWMFRSAGIIPDARRTVKFTKAMVRATAHAAYHSSKQAIVAGAPQVLQSSGRAGR